jgi:outer membrane autotransporter protein
MAAAAWALAPPLAERADRRFTALDQASFTETGAGSRNLAASGQAISSVRTLLGGRLSRDIDLGEGIVINTSLKLGWAHALSDTGRTTTASFASTPGSTFAIEGAQRRRDRAIVGIGFASKVDPSASVYLRSDGDVSERDAAHGVDRRRPLHLVRGRGPKTVNP